MVSERRGRGEVVKGDSEPEPKRQGEILGLLTEGRTIRGFRNRLADTITQLEEMLCYIIESESIETDIATELNSIKRQWAGQDLDGNSFYEEMEDESIARTRNLIRYRARAQNLLDRLRIWEQVDKDAPDSAAN